MSNRQRRIAISRVHRAARAALEETGLSAGAYLVVAVSGGPDSLALLYTLHSLASEMGLRLHVAHLDHQLRDAESRDDAEFVLRTCEDLDVPCTAGQVDVPALRRREGRSTEEAAREARYEFLARVASECGADAVALGHTADDQAETVLMHLVRGSALPGLRGMDALSHRVIAGTTVALVRPLLTVWRDETVEYCRARSLAPREDASNVSTEPTRNQVRLELVPEIERYNPSFRAALVRLASAAGQDLRYIERQVDEQWPRVARAKDGEVTLDASALAALPPALANHMLLRAVSAVKQDLTDVEQGHVDEMLRLVYASAGASLDLPGGIRFRVGYGEVSVARADADRCPLPSLKGEHLLKVPGETRLSGWRIEASAIESDSSSNEDYAPHTARLDYDAVGRDLTVRSRQPGDRIQPLGMEEAKKLQDLMVDEKVPGEWRDRVPLVVSPRGIVWVVGHRIAHWARVTEATEQILELRFEMD